MPRVGLTRILGVAWEWGGGGCGCLGGGVKARGRGTERVGGGRGVDWSKTLTPTFTAQCCRSTQTVGVRVAEFAGLSFLRHFSTAARELPLQPFSYHPCPLLLPWRLHRAFFEGSTPHRCVWDKP